MHWAGGAFYGFTNYEPPRIRIYIACTNGGGDMCASEHANACACAARALALPLAAPCKQS
eukprot:scaffold23175_cov115-Isochrysis_galbana.AAC.4